MTSEAKDIKFLNFRISTKRMTLYKDDEVVPIQPKALLLLVFLIENRERVVSKDEIQQGVWQGAVIGDAAITRCLMKVRLAIGDDANEQYIIRTMHGRGYRFLPQVTFITETSASFKSGRVSVSSEQKKAGMRKRLYYSAGVVLALILLTVSSVQIFTSASPKETRVVILPTLHQGIKDADWIPLGLSAVTSRMLMDANLKLVELSTLEPDIEWFQQLQSKDFELKKNAILNYFNATHVLMMEVQQANDLRSIKFSLFDDAGTVLEDRYIGSDLVLLVRSITGKVVEELISDDIKPMNGETLQDTFLNEAYARALYFKTMGENLKASTLMNVIVEQSPGHAWARLAFAELLLVAGNLAESRRRFEETLSLPMSEQQTIIAKLGFARALMASRDLQKAAVLAMSAQSMAIEQGYPKLQITARILVSMIDYLGANPQQAQASLMEILAVPGESPGSAFTYERHIVINPFSSLNMQLISQYEQLLVAKDSTGEQLHKVLIQENLSEIKAVLIR